MRAYVIEDVGGSDDRAKCFSRVIFSALVEVNIPDTAVEGKIFPASAENQARTWFCAFGVKQSFCYFVRQ